MQNQNDDLQISRKEPKNQPRQQWNYFHGAKVENCWRCAMKNLRKPEKWTSGINGKVCGKLCGNCEYKEYKD